MHKSLLAALLLAATPALAQGAAAPNPQIDYPAFQALTASVAPQRASRLLAFDAFKAAATKTETLLLDARSARAFARGHIKGAVNLPLTDFTADSLAAVVGANPDRPILIYCNNNFSNNVAPVPVKSVALALNIQTFINLVGYGYPNVYELADVVDFDDARVEWVKGR
jgi:phage shock protein E